MRTSIVAAVLVVSGAMTAAGQISRGEATLPPVFMGVRAVEPLGEPGSWALHIISRGGIHGAGTSDLTIRSDGTATLLRGGVATTSVHPDTLISLGQRIRTITPRWTIDSRLGICSDCVTTLILLTIRDQNGLVVTHTAFWDPTTKGTVPADVLRLHDLAVTLR